MRPKIFLPFIIAVITAQETYPQGRFVFLNARTGESHLFTRIGSVDGPLAGRGIWAHMLAGETPTSLTPVGMAAEHLGGELSGIVYGGIVEVPGSPPFTDVYVQMVAWDSGLWGTALAGVPPEWLGRTDIVTRELSDPLFGPPAAGPRFTQPAIVPVPEPSVLALLALGGTILFFASRGWLGHRSSSQ